MDFAQFLRWEQSTRDTIDVKKMYIDMAGDLVSGILLSQIVFWHLPDRKGKTKLRVEQNGYRWLVKKREDWWDEVRITPKQFDRSIKILRDDEGIVITEIHKYNNSPTIHIRINEDEFLQRVNLKLTKGEFQNLPKGNSKIDERERTLTKNTSETTAETTTTTAPKSSFLFQKGDNSESLSYFPPVKGKVAEKLAADVLQFQVSQNTPIESPHRYLFSLIRKAEKGTLVIPDGYIFPEERTMMEERRREAEAKRLVKDKTEQEQLQKERKKHEEMLRNFNALPESIKEKYISLAKDELGELPPILLKIKAARLTRSNTRIPT